MNTVTIDRSEYDLLLANSEMLADIQAYDAAMKDRGEGMPMPVLRRIIDGENPVRVIREWRGFTQAELARRAGLHRVQLHDIETRKSRGSVDMLKAIAQHDPIDARSILIRAHFAQIPDQFRIKAELLHLEGFAINLSDQIEVHEAIINGRHDRVCLADRCARQGIVTARRINHDKISH